MNALLHAQAQGIAAGPDPLATPDGGNVVTASALVRHFGVWQERAVQEPVYILHRGRPRFVLATIEIMQALCAPHHDVPGIDDQAAFGALLELTEEIIVICDQSLNIVALSGPARVYFGEPGAVGAPLARIAAEPGLAVAAQAIERVATSGHSENMDIAPARYPGRRLRMTLSPHPLGVAMTARDVTAVDELHAARAVQRAQEEATAIAGGIATAQLGLRGYVDAAPAALCAITGLASEQLLGTRFVSLIDISGRAAVGDAIDSAIRDGCPTALNTVLLVNRAAPLPVRIGFSPIRESGVVVAIAVIVANIVGLEALKQA